MPLVLSTEFRTSLDDVNWTVTVIDQRRLPPMLLTSPRITPPREPPWRMITKVSNSKSGLQGHKGHPYWCHSIGQIRFPVSLQSQLCAVNLAPSPRYYHLFVISQNLKRLTWPWTHPFGGNYHACTKTSVPLASPIPKIWFGTKKNKNGSRDPDHVPFKGDLSSVC